MTVNNTQTQTQANTQTQNNQGEVKGQVESESGVQGVEEQGGGGGGGRGGQEFAQTDTSQQSVETAQAQGGQPAELASTGVNTGALALIGALCVVASLLLFRRRRTA